MKPVELYARVRHACHVEGLSQREAARRFGIDPKTVAKMLRHAVPPGYRRSKPAARPKLDGFTATIDQIVMADRSAPAKQRHTAKRIFDRLREEHQFPGGYTIVKDYVRSAELRSREMFVPLTHTPGEAQAERLREAVTRNSVGRDACLDWRAAAAELRRVAREQHLVARAGRRAGTRSPRDWH